MRSAIWSSILMAGSCLAQGDIVALLKSQPDLSTLLELVGLVDGLADKLASSSNITIVAPTNDAFAAVPRDVPEGEAIEYKNDSIAIGALLSNHVFKGVYPSDVITDTPTFAQTLLDISFVNYRQPFSNFTGGQYNELIKNGDDVCIISGEQTISTVTQADIKLGEGITIHKIDTVLSFGAPLQLFTYRSGYFGFNGALEAAGINIDFGLTGAESTGLNLSDYTIFVPTDEAFKNIGSVVASADQATLQEVLKYHIIPNNVIFSTSLGNVTVKSLQGDDLVFTVLPDGSAWVNNARITFPNTILYNGVAHVIDSVLAPGPFDRAAINPFAPAASRLAFPSASSVSALPFPSNSLTFFGDLMTYTTTPELLRTAVAVATEGASMKTSVSAGVSASAATRSSASVTGPHMAEYTGAASEVVMDVGMAIAVAVGMAAIVL